ncbi:MAG: response regulator transcription factor [Armatimonadetes bacterium]|nr:response regulator transcription factor [Armatimonadota bacterium]
MNEKILIIEDEALIADSVSYALKKEGYQVLVATDGAQGLAMAREQSPDLILLDIMLPTIDGFEICRILRKETSIPIIMLTAKGEEVDRVVGLELGADDYVIKPFSIRELIARLKAVLRRSSLAEESGRHEVLRVGDLTVDCSRRIVKLGDKTIYLPLKEFDLLRILVKNRDRVMTRDMLLNAVWAEDAYETSRTLDVHIRWLREKIEDNPSLPKRIVTVRGIGYMYVGQSDDKED